MAFTLNSRDYKDPQAVMVQKPKADGFEPISLETFHCISLEGGVQTLKARDYKDPQVVVVKRTESTEDV